MIVDCAPTGETLRLLSFPDVVTWWLEKILPSQRKLGPLARTMLDIPLPGDDVLDEIERLARNLVAMNGILRDRSLTSIRLVTSPDRMVVKEAMRTFTYLNLYGYLTDAVVVNRVLPEAADGYFAAWRDVQAEQMELVRSAFAPLPILVAPWLPQEVIGPERLDELADELFDGDAEADALDPAALLHDRPLTGALDRERPRHPAAAAAVRRARRDRAEEDRPRGDRARRAAEAHDHPARRAHRLRRARRTLRGRRARGDLRARRRGCRCVLSRPSSTTRCARSCASSC